MFLLRQMHAEEYRPLELSGWMMVQRLQPEQTVANDWQLEPQKQREERHLQEMVQAESKTRHHASEGDSSVMWIIVQRPTLGLILLLAEVVGVTIGRADAGVGLASGSRTIFSIALKKVIFLRITAWYSQRIIKKYLFHSVSAFLQCLSFLQGKR